MAMEGVVAQNAFPSISVTPFAKNSMRKFHLCHAHTRTTRCSSAVRGVPLHMEKFIHNYHNNIIKQCAFVHVPPPPLPENTIMGCRGLNLHLLQHPVVLFSGFT